MKTARKQVTFDSLWDMHLEEMKKTKAFMDQCPWENKEFYAAWCAQFFYFVAHATRLLAASAAHLQLDRDALHLRFIDHCQEEKHHEKLFLKDLEAMGKNIEDYPEHPLAAFMYESQYYLIDYKDPIALFGSILFLEGMSLVAGPEIYARLKKTYTDECCHFIKVHVNDDQDHIEKAKKALSTLSAKEIEVIAISYKQSAYAFNTMLKEIQAQIPVKVGKVHKAAA